jgi:hypothetical protein
MPAAARFVIFSRAHQDDRVVESSRLAVNQALGPAGRGAADQAYRLEFIDLFGFGEQLGHRAERLAPEVQVQTGYNHPLARFGPFAAEIQQVGVKELGLVNGNNLGIRAKLLAHLVYTLDRGGAVVITVVGSDLDRVIAVVNTGLEDLDDLAGDYGSFNPANEFFGFAAKHAAADNFNPTALFLAGIHMQALPFLLGKLIF